MQSAEHREQTADKKTHNYLYNCLSGLNSLNGSNIFYA